MKKVISIFMLVILLAMQFVGCVKSDKKQATSTTEETTAPEKELVTLEWYLGGTPQENQDQVFAEINKIMKEKIGVEINFHFVDWNNYGQHMSMLMTSGTKVDLMFTSNWANDFYSDVSKGAYQTINFDDINTYGPNIIKEVPKGAWEAAKIQGQYYAIPNVQVQARWPSLLLQKKYIDKYNFDVSQVKEIEDFTPLFEQIAENEQGIYPIDVRKNTNILSFYLSKMGLEYFGESNPLGIYIEDEELKVQNIYKTAEMKEFLFTLRQWYEKGIIRSDAASVTDTTAEKQNGRLAALFAVNNPDTVINQSRSMNLAPEDLVMVPLSDPYLATSSIVATMTAINAQSQNPIECIKALNVMFDQEDTRCANLMSFGIEGQQYTKVADDLIELIPQSGYYVDCGWAYGSLFNSMRTNPDQPAWRPTGPNINKNAKVSPIMGFSLDSTSIKSELAQVAAVMDEFMPALLTGSTDVDTTLEELNKKLENAGIQAVQQEIQSQIDKWKSGK